MAVTYNNNEIKIYPSDKKFNVDVVYARPEDIIKLDFLLNDVKVTFVNGDVDIIFPNGSVISLASYGTLAFDKNAPKIYDAEGRLVSLEALLQQVQVLNPEDSVLILANRDKYKLVDDEDEVNKIIMATNNEDTEETLGIPITAAGITNIKTKGAISNILDPNGLVTNPDLKKGIGDFVKNSYTTFYKGNTDTDNRSPGNTFKEVAPKLVYNFLFGDQASRGAPKTINGQKADYYGILFGVGNDKKPEVQLDPIDMNGMGGEYKNKIFDSRSVDGQIKRILNLDYSGGIFPQTIAITGIPGDLDISGKKKFDLFLMAAGTTKLTYDASKNTYYLTQLDPLGRIKLNFVFSDEVADQTLLIKYTLLYYDPKTATQKATEATQDVGIRSISHKADLTLNSSVINKGGTGLIVNANTAGTGDKIFIGGNTGNDFTSIAGNSLIFSGNGNDVINVSGGDNLIYGSGGYNIITGSGNKYQNLLVFSGEKEYNSSKYFGGNPDDNKQFMQSDVIKDSYYQTIKKGMSFQFYLGVPKENVLELWLKLGVAGNPGNIKDHFTSNFVRTFASVTVIGDRDGEISITKIVSSRELDIFNLYFQGVTQKVELYSGKKYYNGIGNQLILHTIKDNNVVVDFGRSEMSTVCSQDGSAYNFQTSAFNRITAKGNADLTIKLSYGRDKDIKKDYSQNAYFIAGEGSKNTLDFSELLFVDDTGHIEFNSDIRYNMVTYFGVKNKVYDNFQGFNNVIGSKGNDIFYGSANSKSYIFDGFSGTSNVLSYERSLGGVTFDANEQKIYKVSDKNLKDYEKYKTTADIFQNISTIKLSSINNVFLAAGNVSLGVNFDLYLDGSHNTLKYDYDENITAIEVYADSLTVIKDKTQDRKDIFKKNNKDYGVIEYIGTKGDNLFHGGFSFSNIFNGGTGTNNILSYNEGSSATMVITVDLFKSTVFKAGKTDSYINIQNIIGTKGNDTFSIGNIDPTNEDDRKKISEISIDGGGGDNIFRFNSVNVDNLNKSNFALVFNVDTGEVAFYDKNNKKIDLEIKLNKTIKTIYGTLAKNMFIASVDKDFIFDGSGVKNKFDPTKDEAYGSTLNYSSFKTNLIFDLSQRFVNKAEGKKDHFRNIQGFIGGSGDDTFLSSYSLENKVLFFDGGKGNNSISYEGVFVDMILDFSKGTIRFGLDGSIDINHYYKNINTFLCGGGENIIRLAVDMGSFFDQQNENGVTIKIKPSKSGNSRIVIDFDLWEQVIGTEEKPFVITPGAASCDNGKEGSKFIKYEWDKADGFVGSKKGSYFVVTDKTEGPKGSEGSFRLDGNKDAENSVLDYSGLNAPNLKLDLNLSEGYVIKNVNGIAKDTIYNFTIIKLSNFNNTVKISDNITNNLKSLKLVDGMNGTNTLDFSAFTKDVEVQINKEGFSLSKVEGDLKIEFIKFFKMLASKGNTVFKVTDNSNSSKVEIIGNPLNLNDGKYTILDFTDLKDVNYWAWVEEDRIDDPSSIGKLTWGGDKSAVIKAKYMSKILLGNGKNNIYGSVHNNSYYIGSTDQDSFNKIDYSATKNDSVIVTLGDKEQIVRFNNAASQDKLSNFHYILTTNYNDTFIIASLDKLSSMILDGNKGENTLSFTLLKESIEIDLTKDVLNINKVDIKVINIQKLVLTEKDDTIIIGNGDKKEFLFKTVDGYRGKNTIDVRDQSIIIFNEKGDNKINLSKHGDATFNNFYHLKTNATTGNRFYGSYTNNMKFAVVGVQSEEGVVNCLSYKQSSEVKIDFSKGEVSKSGSSTAIDIFEGINYFEGATGVVNTFYLSKTLNNVEANKYIKTIYINIPPKDSGAVNKDNIIQDIIDVCKVGDNAILDISKSQLFGSEIEYKWNNIGKFYFTSNQTIYVSFDESFSYIGKDLNGTDERIVNTALIFSNMQGSKGKQYKNAYIVIDSEVGLAVTYDETNNKLANISFSNVPIIKGTGSSKDVFYGSMNNIEYYSTNSSKTDIFNRYNSRDGSYGSGTLSYNNFMNEFGIKVVFSVDNSATITENTTSQTKKLDKGYGINTYIGTLKDDTFIIAKNKNMGRITIDGNGGSYNSIDFSQTSEGDKGIELDTTKGVSLGDFDYIFKNITTFKLTKGNDILLGSLDNIGFVNKDSKLLKADIIVDANGGTDNVIDYTKYLIGTKDNIIKVNADLNLATISKEGKNKDGVLVNSNDTIAVLKDDPSKTQINFQKIILNGEYVSNFLTVSGRESDRKIYVEVKNPSEGLSQTLNLEFVEQKIDIIWDGQKIDGNDTNILLTTLNGSKFSFLGFNSINLSKLDSTLTIKENANLITKGGRLYGGHGNNTLIIDTNNKNSSVAIYLSSEKINLNLKGDREAIYTISAFNAFVLGAMTNRVFSNDRNSITVTFTNKEAINEVSYTELTSSYVTLDFKQITNDGAHLVVSKQDLYTGNVYSKDTIYNINNLVLTNNNDTIEIIDDNAPSLAKKITIDGAGGENTLSFKNWDKEVDLSKLNSNGNIEIANYILKRFTNVTLRDKNDEIILNATSSLSIDGGGGQNKVTYAGIFSPTADPVVRGSMIIQEYEKRKEGGGVIFGMLFNKNSKFTDNLFRFNYIVLPDALNTYMAQFVNIKPDNPTNYTIDFSADRQVAEGASSMNYSKLEGANAGIYAILNYGETKDIIVNVYRDYSKKESNKSATCITDKLINVPNIIGSSLGGDIFEVVFRGNTGGKHCKINSFGEKVSTLHFVSDSQITDTKLYTNYWVFEDKHAQVYNESIEKSFLSFTTNVSNIIVIHKPSEMNEKGIPSNVFKLTSLDQGNLNLVYKVDGKRLPGAVYGQLDLSAIITPEEKMLHIEVTQIKSQDNMELIRADISYAGGKTFRTFGLDSIKGSAIVANLFHIRYEAESNSFYPGARITLSGGSSFLTAGDNVNILNINKNRTLILTGAGGGVVRLYSKDENLAEYFIHNVRNYNFDFNATNYQKNNFLTINININSLMSGAAPMNFTSTSKSVLVSLSVDKNINDFRAVIEKAGTYFTSNQLGLVFSLDIASKLIINTENNPFFMVLVKYLNQEQNAPAKVYEGFNELDFSELAGLPISKITINMSKDSYGKPCTWFVTPFLFNPKNTQQKEFSNTTFNITARDIKIVIPSGDDSGAFIKDKGSVVCSISLKLFYDRKDVIDSITMAARGMSSSTTPLCEVKIQETVRDIIIETSVLASGASLNAFNKLQLQGESGLLNALNVHVEYSNRKQVLLLRGWCTKHLDITVKSDLMPFESIIQINPIETCLETLKYNFADLIKADPDFSIRTKTNTSVGNRTISYIISLPNQKKAQVDVSGLNTYNKGATFILPNQSLHNFKDFFVYNFVIYKNSDMKTGFVTFLPEEGKYFMPEPVLGSYERFLTALNMLSKNIVAPNKRYLNIILTAKSQGVFSLQIGPYKYFTEVESTKISGIIDNIKGNDISAFGFTFVYGTTYWITEDDKNTINNLILGCEGTGFELYKLIFKGNTTESKGVYNLIKYSERDLLNQTISFELNRLPGETLMGWGQIGSSILTTSNIQRYDFSRISNCKDFYFNIKGVLSIYSYKDSNWSYNDRVPCVDGPNQLGKKEYTVRNVSDISKLATQRLDYLIKAAPMSTDGVWMVFKRTEMVVNISKGGGSTPNHLSSEVVFKDDVGREVKTSLLYCTNINFFKIIYDSQNDYASNFSFTMKCNVYDKDTASYIFLYANLSNPEDKGTIMYSSGDIPVTIKRGYVIRGTGENEIVDFYGGFRQVALYSVSLALLAFEKENTTVELFKNHSEFQIKPISYNIEKVDQFFIALDDITKSNNNVSITIKDVNTMFIQHDKNKTYQVFWVKSNEYQDYRNNMSTFDTTGYFVIYENNSKAKIYFTGKDISKYNNVFEQILNNSPNKTIKIVNNYKDLIDAIENPNLATDKLISQPNFNEDDYSLNINYENTNHSTPNFFEEEEEEEEKEEEFYNIHQEQQHEGSDIYNSQSVNNNNYHNEEEDLQVLCEQEGNNNLYNNDINTKDILEFDSEDINSILNSSLDDYLEQNENNDNTSFKDSDNIEDSISNQENTDNISDAIHEISTVEDINITNKQNIFISESIIDSEPSSKIEESVDKHSAINNNYK